MSASGFEKFPVHYGADLPSVKFRITELANMSYGFQPRELKSTSGYSPKSGDPDLTYWLIAPGELPEDVQQFHRTLDPTAVVSHRLTYIKENKLEVAVGFNTAVEVAAAAKLDEIETLYEELGYPIETEEEALRLTRRGLEQITRNGFLKTITSEVLLASYEWHIRHSLEPRYASMDLSSRVNNELFEHFDVA